MYPIFLRIGTFTIRYYGVMIAAAFIVAVYVASRESERKGLGHACMVDFAPYAIIGGILGARLYYVIFHSAEFVHNPLDIVRIWQGGLAFHGGILGGFIAGIWFTRRRGIPFWRFADAGAPAIILAQAIGRAGCFLNGCCYGRETEVPWSVTFRNPESMARLNVPLHPTQLYEIAGNLGIFFCIWRIRRKKIADGYLFLLYAIMYSVLRFVLEFFRADSLYPLGLKLPWAQVAGIGMVVVCLACMYVIKRRYNTGNY